MITPNATRSAVLAVGLYLAGAGLAVASPFTQVDTQASHITFGYTQMNVPMQGELKALKAPEFSFDPAQPDHARVVLEVPLSGVDSGNDEANAELKKPEWLNTDAAPIARFESSGVKSTGDNTFDVSGPLTIKGKTHDIHVPFTFKPNGDTGVFEGNFTFQRADFGIGEGPWGDFGIVANDITITFHVVAAR